MARGDKLQCSIALKARNKYDDRNLPELLDSAYHNSISNTHSKFTASTVNIRKAVGTA